MSTLYKSNETTETWETKEKCCKNEWIEMNEKPESCVKKMNEQGCMNITIEFLN